jgi:hypothetical protein
MNKTLLGLVTVFAVMIGLLTWALNPIGELKLRRIERDISKGLQQLPRGADPGTVKQFAIKKELDPGELSSYLWSYPPPPKGAAYQIRATHPYVAHYIFGSAYVIVDFSFDKNKRFLSAEVSRLGTSL